MTNSMSSLEVDFADSTGAGQALESQPRPSLAAHLRVLAEYRGLLLMWTLREIKVRYKQSFLGAAWAVLQPLGLMLVFSVVFSYLTRMPTEGAPYPVFSYVALLPWTFLATSISFAAPSMIANIALVSKIYFPREILPIAIVCAALFDFVVASSLMSGLFLYYKLPFTASLLWVPLLLSIQIALTLGIVFIFAALSVRYRDVRFIVPIMLQIWMFASPVIYPSSLIPARLRTIYALNPMVGLIDAYRAVALRGQAPDWGPVLASAAISLLLLGAGYRYFKRAESFFADII